MLLRVLGSVRFYDYPAQRRAITVRSSTNVAEDEIEAAAYFGGSPQTRRNRNLVETPAVCVHLESRSDVVILHGDAQELRAPVPKDATRWHFQDGE